MTHDENRALTSVSPGAQHYPLFAPGTHTRNGKDRVRVEACNVPVVIGGVRVECDDVLLGDDDGLEAISKTPATALQPDTTGQCTELGPGCNPAGAGLWPLMALFRPPCVRQVHGLGRA